VCEVDPVLSAHDQSMPQTCAWLCMISATLAEQASCARMGAWEIRRTSMEDQPRSSSLSRLARVGLPV
jgi:hypothetical protein